MTRPREKRDREHVANRNGMEDLEGTSGERPARVNSPGTRGKAESHNTSGTRNQSESRRDTGAREQPAGAGARGRTAGMDERRGGMASPGKSGGRGASGSRTMTAPRRGVGHNSRSR